MSRNDSSSQLDVSKYHPLSRSDSYTSRSRYHLSRSDSSSLLNRHHVPLSRSGSSTSVSDSISVSSKNVTSKAQRSVSTDRRRSSSHHRNHQYTSSPRSEAELWDSSNGDTSSMSSKNFDSKKTKNAEATAISSPSSSWQTAVNGTESPSRKAR